jgi:hypothetical protein
MKKIDYQTYKKPSDFIKFEQGANTIRIVSTGVIGLQHSLKTANRFVPLGPCTEDSKCEHCNKGYEPKMVWKWLVYDHSDNKVKILDAKVMIGDQICNLAKKYGDPQNFDIVINKTGEGLKTEYKCDKATKDVEIPEEEKANIEFKKKRLINKFFVTKKE